MLYEKLNPDMQKAVDAYARRLAVFDWGRRSDRLAEASIPFSEGLAADKASLAARGFITAVLERWGSPAVEDPRQAALYLTSLHPGHREAAEEYLAEHPEMAAAVQGDEGPVS
jgi:hypothetical protein